MAKTTTINIDVDTSVKEQAGEILEGLGLSFSDAFNLMLDQVRIQRALPFEVEACSLCRTPKAEVLELIGRIESGEEKLHGPFKTKEDLWESLEI